MRICMTFFPIKDGPPGDDRPVLALVQEDGGATWCRASYKARPVIVSGGWFESTIADGGGSCRLDGSVVGWTELPLPPNLEEDN